MRLLLPLCYLALVVYALVGVVQADEEETGRLPKTLWVLAIVFLPLAGSIAWMVVSRGARRRRAAGSYRTGFPADRAPRAQYPRRGRTWEAGAPSAGDMEAAGSTEDDPEYRWLMEQARKKREAAAREDRAAQDGGPGEHEAGPAPA